MRCSNQSKYLILFEEKDCFMALLDFNKATLINRQVPKRLSVDCFLRNCLSTVSNHFVLYKQQIIQNTSQSLFSFYYSMLLKYLFEPFWSPDISFLCPTKYINLPKQNPDTKLSMSVRPIIYYILIHSGINVMSLWIFKIIRDYSMVWALSNPLYYTLRPPQ